MEDGSFLRMNLKMTLSGRGPGHVTQYRNFGTYPYNWQNIKGEFTSILTIAKQQI